MAAPGRQRAFSEDLFEARGLLEEAVAGRTSGAVVRSGAGFGYLGVAFENDPSVGAVNESGDFG
ncbi:MAG: hypothetical protein ACREA2_11040 [Blastocatellia bacterium]